MAPLAPTGRSRALELLRKGELPISLGSPHPSAVILQQDGLYRLRALVIDEARAQAESERAHAQGEPWMPEHYYALGEPTGRVHAEAAELSEFIRQVEALDWRGEW